MHGHQVRLGQSSDSTATNPDGASVARAACPAPAAAERDLIWVNTGTGAFGKTFKLAESNREGKAVVYFDWNPAFDTGIPGIDYEHHQLVNMLNEIHHLIAERADSQKISDALAQFHRLASAHFALEERIMQDRKYPGLKGRRQTHYRLLDQVREIMDAFDAGDHRLEDLPVTLRAWLAEAMEIDTKLFVEINEAGL